jgi:hypothetical protein
LDVIGILVGVAIAIDEIGIVFIGRIAAVTVAVDANTVGA